MPSNICFPVVDVIVPVVELFPLVLLVGGGGKKEDERCGLREKRGNWKKWGLFLGVYLIICC
jgi:hypothetical protein